MKTLNVYSSNLFSSLLKEIFLFPFWWYSVGVFLFVLSLKNFIVKKEKDLAFSVWVKNIFVPMYGQRDIAGVLISIFIRLFQIIVRGMILIFYVAISLILLLAWLVIPVIISYQIANQLFYN